MNVIKIDALMNSMVKSHHICMAERINFHNRLELNYT